MKKPNILLIQADQLMAKSIGAYGNPVCHTPNLDQLVKNSILFENAYCNFPLCAPSRSSMATGLLCSDIGVYDNAAELPACIPTYAHYLRDSGYLTTLSGKIHFIGPDQYHGFNERLTPDIYPADFSWVPNWNNEGKRDTNDSRSVLISGICEDSVQIQFDEMVTRETIKHLDNLRRLKNKDPFFLQVSFTHPHEPYLCRKEYWDIYRERMIPPLSVPALKPEEHDPHSQRLLADFSILNTVFDEVDISRARRAYFGSISFLDNQIGKILKSLSDAGITNETVVIFTSDHGDMLGERGLWFKKHFFESSIRVPLFMAIPNQPAKRIVSPVSLVDLLPTLMGLAEGSGWSSNIDKLDGIDLTQWISEGSELNRSLYAEYLAESAISPMLMILRKPYKFIWSNEDPYMLYDLDNDPNERTNIARMPDNSNLVNSFLDEIQEKWNPTLLYEKIIQSQRRRLKIMNAQALGNKPRWNHGEKTNEQVLWYRGQGGYNEWAFPSEVTQ
ncbi:MAG: choline-sulfatase [Gammaproteobacteria bacterium]|nr:choline-sulfatase [Gammaproteobacteria bacterium]MCY4217792.1 choline-sulfatase [Gammaproteobacteria bacterium]MCY4274684.1 choline-sulfatase [Gammaproteobacteria bacterium]